MAFLSRPEYNAVGFSREVELQRLARFDGPDRRGYVELFLLFESVEGQLDAFRIVTVRAELHIARQYNRIDRIVDGRYFQRNVAGGMAAGEYDEVETAILFSQLSCFAEGQDYRSATLFDGDGKDGIACFDGSREVDFSLRGNQVGRR